MAAMRILKAEFGDRFAQVFKTITVDNGSEFADFAQGESRGTQVFFAHPYPSWERAQNGRHNGLFRAFVPKGTSMENYSAEYILASADELNARPRKKLGYATPEELFDSFLDQVYAASSNPACPCQGIGCALPSASLTAPAVLAAWKTSPAYAELILFMWGVQLAICEHNIFCFFTVYLTGGTSHRIRRGLLSCQLQIHLIGSVNKRRLHTVLPAQG